MTADPRPDPLLHSLLLFWEQIETALDIVRPARIAEIGSESGAMTAALTRWAAAHDAAVVSIDPAHAPATQRLAAMATQLRLVESASPWGLAEVGEADFWLVDGDHNHWTVAAELAHVFGAGGSESALNRVALLHDIGWPCARRDQYYAPERIPAEGRREHSYAGGVTLQNAGLIDGGFRGEGAFAYATVEGGPANGVLTAVEDLLETRSDLRLISLPCIFGLGVLFSMHAPWAEALVTALAPLDDLPLLRTLEQNRLDLYLRLLENQDDRARERAAAAAERREADQREALSAQVIADLEARMHRLEAENRMLQARRLAPSAA